MKEIIQLGNYMCFDGSNFPALGRLYSLSGIAPTVINFGAGGSKSTKVVEWE